MNSKFEIGDIVVIKELNTYGQVDSIDNDNVSISYSLYNRDFHNDSLELFHRHSEDNETIKQNSIVSNKNYIDGKILELLK